MNDHKKYVCNIIINILTHKIIIASQSLDLRLCVRPVGKFRRAHAHLHITYIYTRDTHTQQVKVP